MHIQAEKDGECQHYIHARTCYQDDETLPRGLRAKTSGLVVLAVLARHLHESTQRDGIQTVQRSSALPTLHPGGEADTELIHAHAKQLCKAVVTRLMHEHERA